MTALVAGADGTRASAAGLTLRPQASQLPTGRSARWAFTIRDAHGMAVTRFERDQTKLLHLIVVRSDLTGYQHVHPTLGKGARFTIPITLPQAGRYRAIADFTTAGKRYALGTDLTVPGTATSQTLPPAATSTTTDGYSVMLDHGDVRAGKTTTMAFTITRGRQPVTALQPYLGAYGHLVALRHPEHRLFPRAPRRPAATPRHDHLRRGAFNGRHLPPVCAVPRRRPGAHAAFTVIAKQ